MAVFMTNRPVASSPIGHRCKIEADSNKIFVTIEGRVPQTITADDLKKQLTPADYNHIKTLEESMQEHYRIWQSIYPKRNSSPDPLKNREAHEIISRLILDMEGDLNGIIKFVESLGLRLDDHYMHIRDLVARFRRERESKPANPHEFFDQSTSRSAIKFKTSPSAPWPGCARCANGRRFSSPVPRHPCGRASATPSGCPPRIQYSGWRTDGADHGG